MKWKRGDSREEYLVVRHRARRKVYRSKSESKKPLLDKLYTTVGRNEVLRMAKQMKRENTDITGKQCVGNDKGRIVVGNGNVKEALGKQSSTEC